MRECNGPRVSNEISESPKFREISRNVSVSFGQTFREISHNFGRFGTKDFAKFRSVSVGFGRIRNFGQLRNFRDVKTNARNFLWSMGCLARLVGGGGILNIGKNKFPTLLKE